MIRSRKYNLPTESKALKVTCIKCSGCVKWLARIVTMHTLTVQTWSPQNLGLQWGVLSNRRCNMLVEEFLHCIKFAPLTREELDKGQAWHKKRVQHLQFRHPAKLSPHCITSPLFSRQSGNIQILFILSNAHIYKYNL